MGGNVEHNDPHDLLHSDLIGASIKTAGMGATFGVVAATLQGLWVRATSKSVLNHTLTRSAQFGAFGAIFHGTSIASAKLRETNDSVNLGIGGAVVGTVAGFLRIKN